MLSITVLSRHEILLLNIPSKILTSICFIINYTIFFLVISQHLLFRYFNLFFFFFNDTATTEIYTLSLHDALPICGNHHELIGIVHHRHVGNDLGSAHIHLDGFRRIFFHQWNVLVGGGVIYHAWLDRKSTRLNSSHLVISYAVFCLKKKKCPQSRIQSRRRGDLYTLRARHGGLANSTNRSLP